MAKKIKKPKKFNPAKAKRKLDRLFSEYILARDKRVCQRCGKTEGKFDTSHCIPREVLSLRWTPENAYCLCFKDHKLVWHKNPLVGVKWLRQYLGDNVCNRLLAASEQSFEFNENVAACIEAELKEKIATVCAVSNMPTPQESK